MYIPSSDEIINLIDQRIPYVDSVAVWSPRILQDYERDTLESLCGSLFFPDNPKLMPFHPEWQCRYTLHQPTPKALTYLHEITGGTYLINHVALALDYITQSLSDAELVHDFFVRHLVKRGRGKQKTCGYKNTHYSSQEAWVNNNIAMYADKPPKITGGSCCHLEWRSNKKDPVEKHGINSLLDLIDFDHHAFWKKNMRLRELNIIKIGKVPSNNQRMRKTLMISRGKLPPTNQFKRHAEILIRSCQRSNISYCIQDVLDGIPFVDYRYLKKLPNDPFLPPQQRHKLND